MAISRDLFFDFFLFPTALLPFVNILLGGLAINLGEFTLGCYPLLSHLRLYQLSGKGNYAYIMA